jgi:hypothetical protein
VSDSGIGAQARLDAWRTQGADRVDPLRFARIDALARRTSAQQGAVRKLLEARLAELVGAYADDLAGRAAADPQRESTFDPATHPHSAMAALLEHLAREAALRTQSVADNTSDASSGSLANLDDVRRISTHIRAESQLRHALEQAPENAGPLNSASLVHRALSLMHEVSPEYLQPFLAYVDALAWLEGMGLHAAPAAKAAPSAASGGKRPRGKARSRRG